MAMNIAKLQAQLQHVPDQALIGYVQNPDGHVPSYLALAELSRRKEIREGGNKQGQPQQEQPSVAEQMVQETQQGLGSLVPQGGQPQAPMPPQAPAPQPAPDMSAQGVAQLPTGDMYNEQSFANGGIIAFAEGGQPESYKYDYDYEKYYKDPVAALAPVPKALTLPDYEGQLSDTYEYFGVDPKFFEKEKTTIEADKAKELEDVKRMGQSDLLFALAEGLGSTPGGVLRGLSASTGNIRQSMSELNKNKRAVEASAKEALRSNRQAQQAFNIGDAKGAMSAIEKRDEAIRNAQTKNAELETTMRGIIYKEKGDNAAKNAEVNAKVYDKAIQSMKQMYGEGAFSTLYQRNSTAYQEELNRHIKAADTFIRTGKMPDIPKSSYVMDLIRSKGPTSAAPSASTTKSTAPATSSAAMPKPKTQADYDALDSGTRYLAPDNTVRTKP